jgi:prepilin-type N-terminal cleavage/methylation domain-containing protein
MARPSLAFAYAVVTARRPSRSSGFTLVELMVVVVIVGVLSILAVVGFRKLVGESRGAEAVYMVNAIKVAQESYHAETGSYANVSTSLCASTTCSALYPQASASAALGDTKVGWGVACGGACNAGMDWSMLPVHVQGGVMYGYSTIAGAAGSTISFGSITWPSGYSINVPSGATTADWFAITGVGDEDMDTVPAVVFGSSFSNDLLVMNEGN